MGHETIQRLVCVALFLAGNACQSADETAQFYAEQASFWVTHDAEALKKLHGKDRSLADERLIELGFSPSCVVGVPDEAVTCVNKQGYDYRSEKVTYLYSHSDEHNIYSGVDVTFVPDKDDDCKFKTVDVLVLDMED